MGVTTPFPEPDSPELQRFVVQSPQEIAGLLEDLRVGAVPLNVFLEPGSAFDVAALLDVDDDGPELLFESIGRPSMRERILDASRVTFVGFVDAVKLQFDASGAKPGTRGGRHAFSVPMPTRLLRLQRRSTARVRPRVDNGALCCFCPASGADSADVLRVLDLSVGGLALLDDAANLRVDVGCRIWGCQLHLPGVGSIEADLWVRHVARLPGNEGARLIGCEFDALTPSARAMLDTYLGQLGATLACPPGRV